MLGGQSDASQRYLAPTVVKDVTPGDSLMSDEIFGPILALVPVAGFKEAISLVNSMCVLSGFSTSHHVVFSEERAFK